MKRLVWIIAIIFMGFGICLTDAQAKIPGEENLIQKIKEVLTPTVSVPKNLPESFHPVCATPAFVWIIGHRDELSPEAQKELSLLMPAGRPTYSTTENTYDTPGGHFRIHYVTSTADSVYKSHVDVSPADGVPDYVNFVGGIIDSMWRKEVDTLGYLAPPDDGWYTLYGFDNGGNNRYDIYLKSLEYSYLGYTEPEYLAPPDYIGATSFIVLRNDYSLYGGNYNNYPRVTSAHEFFHAVQFGYDVNEMEYVSTDTISPYHPYWMELSATWMEDVAYDDINDYVNYLPYFYYYPWLSLKTFSLDSGDLPRYFHAYAACVWAFYLSKKFGRDVIKSVWTECGQLQGDNVLPATQSVLLTKGSSFNEAFREFSIWNYFTSSRADTVNFYSEGNSYPLVDIYPTQVYYSYPVNVNTVPKPPEVLGTNYVMFVTEVTPGGLSVNFNGSDSAMWKASLIGFSTFLPISFNEFNLDTFQSGNLKVHNWSYYDNIIMVPAVVTQTSGSFNYSYQATYDSTLTKVEEQQALVPGSFALSQNYPNPFNPSTIIPFTVNSSQFMVHSPIHTTLIIYNILGQKVRTLVNEERVPGNYQVVWDGKDDKGEKIGSGVYFYRLQRGDYSETKRMVLIK